MFTAIWKCSIQNIAFQFSHIFKKNDLPETPYLTQLTLASSVKLLMFRLVLFSHSLVRYFSEKTLTLYYDN